MTEPVKDLEINEARQEADRALELARNRKARGDTLAEKWRKSREDNNFRAMLRSLASGGE